MIVGEKVITGEWDGQPIWRTRTAEEVLLDLLKKKEDEKTKSLSQRPEN